MHHVKILQYVSVLKQAWHQDSEFAVDDVEEENSADEDLMLNGGDIESDSDADLDALLEDANRLVGRPSTSNKRAKTGKGRHVTKGGLEEDEEDDEEGQDIMYDDFWGSSRAKQCRAGRKSHNQGKLVAPETFERALHLSDALTYCLQLW